MQLNGQCLCGAVKIKATASKPIVRACHCEMCRRHSSSMFMSLATDKDSIEITGPAKAFQSSDWAERGFCEVCGSTLWYRALDDAHKNLSAGLFKNAADADLKLEFFIDNCPQGYALAGEHRKMNTEEMIALFAPDEGDNT